MYVYVLQCIRTIMGHAIIMRITSIRLQSEIEQSLNQAAARLHRSKSWIINQALQDFFTNQTLEEQRWTETLQALESVRKGKLIPSEKVHSWLSSWGSKKEHSAPKSKK